MPNTNALSPNVLQRPNSSREDSENVVSPSSNVKGTVRFLENVSRKLHQNGTGSARMNMAMQRGGTDPDEDEDEQEDLLDDDFDYIIGENDKRKEKKTATQSLAEFLATSGPEDLVTAQPRFGVEKAKKNRGSLFFRRGKLKNKILANNDASGTRGANKVKKYVALIPEFPLGKILPSPMSPSGSITIFDSSADGKSEMITSPFFGSQQRANRTVGALRSGNETRFGFNSPRILKSQFNQEYPKNSSNTRKGNAAHDKRAAGNLPQHKFDGIGNPGSNATEYYDSEKLDDSLTSSRDGSGSDPGSRRLVSILLPPPPTSRPPAREESHEANKVMDAVRRIEPKQRGNTSENDIVRQQVVFEFQQRQRQRQQHQRQQAEMYSQSNLQVPSTPATTTFPIVRARVAPDKAPRLSLSLSSLELLGQGTFVDFLSPLSNPDTFSSDSTTDGSNIDSTTNKAAPLLPYSVDSEPPHSISLQPSEDVKTPRTNRQGMYGTEPTSSMRSGSRVGDEEEGGDKSFRSAKKVTFMDTPHVVEGPSVKEDAHQPTLPSSAERSTKSPTTEEEAGVKLSLSAIDDLKPSQFGFWDETVQQVAEGNGETMTRSRSSSTLIDITYMNGTVGRELATQAEDFRSRRNGLFGEAVSLEVPVIKSARSEMSIDAAYGITKSNRGAPTSTDSAPVPKSGGRKRVRHVQVQTLPNHLVAAATQTEIVNDSEFPAQAPLTARSAETEESTEQNADLESVLELNRTLRLEIAATRAQLVAETRAKQRVIRSMEQTKDKFDALSAIAYTKLKEVLGERDAFEEALQVYERREMVM